MFVLKINNYFRKKVKKRGNAIWTRDLWLTRKLKKKEKKEKGMHWTRDLWLMRKFLKNEYTTGNWTRDVWVMGQCSNHYTMEKSQLSFFKNALYNNSYSTHGGYWYWHEVRVCWITCSHSCVYKLHVTWAKAPKPATAHCFTLFQVAFDLPIAFWTSLVGSVIEMPTAPVHVDTTISLKA